MFLSCEKAQAADQLKSKVESEGTTSVVDSPEVADAGKQEEVLADARKQEEVSAVASDGNVCSTFCYFIYITCLQLNEVLPLASDGNVLSLINFPNCCIYLHVFFDLQVNLFFLWDYVNVSFMISWDPSSYQWMKIQVIGSC